MNEIFIEFIKQRLLKCIMSYNKFCITIKVKCRIARRQNAIFNLICEFFESAFNAIAVWFVYITCSKTEPSQPAWISMCQYMPASLNMKNIGDFRYSPGMMNPIWTIIQTDNQSTASTQDIYYEFEENEFGEDELANWPMIVSKDSQQYNQFYIKYTKVQYSLGWMTPMQINNSIVIAKLSPMVTRIRLAKHMDVDIDLANIQKTTTKFLEIEYNCGTRSPITIEVPKSHYYAGNEILSKTYILRYLEHLPVYVRWIFIESDYSLRVIDEDSEVFSLNSRQSIRLEPDGYKIVTEEHTNKSEN